MLLLSMISMQGSENSIYMKFVTFLSYLHVRDVHKMLIPIKEFLQLSMILLIFHFSQVKVYHVILLNINDFCITAVLKKSYTSHLHHRELFNGPSSSFLTCFLLSISLLFFLLYLLIDLISFGVLQHY